ncbi:MAG: flavodoxin family protein [Christensenellaceae bacterium]|jgi:multimeric flavodoxin WrbA|nr:flavodoxin family protein [Christensenellaceae bacterium]
MKVLAVLGSPHESGPSSILAREVLRGAQKKGHEVKIYEVNKMNLRGCQGCGVCKRGSVDCVVEDDLQAYWKELHECGALIVSAPNYSSQVCGPMITYMNRHYCLLDQDWKLRLHPGVKLVGVFAQGQADKEKYRAYYDWYLADFQNRAMDLQGVLIHARGDGLEAGDELMQRAYALGGSL